MSVCLLSLGTWQSRGSVSIPSSLGSFHPELSPLSPLTPAPLRFSKSPLAADPDRVSRLIPAVEQTSPPVQSSPISQEAAPRN